MPITRNGKQLSDADLHALTIRVLQALKEKGGDVLISDHMKLNHHTKTVTRGYINDVAVRGMLIAKVTHHLISGMPVFSCSDVDIDGEATIFKFVLSDSLAALRLYSIE